MVVLCESRLVAVRLVQGGEAGLPPSAVSFAELVDGIPQVLGCLKGADGRYVWANDGFADRLGRSADDIVGHTVDELFPLEFARSYAAQDAMVLGTGRPLQRQVELIVRADGRIGWFVTSKSRLLDDRGRAWGLAVLSVDLHAQLESGHSGLAAAIEAIRADAGRPWRVADLAALAGLSPKQLERLARRTLGLSPQRLVQRLRLEHAVHAIVTTDASLGEISAECGFYDQSSFTKQFRAVLGVTPGAYRRLRG
jgi:PAS domain S-box-containing protein